MKALSSGIHRVSKVADLDTDIEGACIRHAQLSCGRFAGELLRTTLVNGSLDSAVFNQRLCGTGILPPGAYTLGFVPAHRESGHLNGHRLARGVWLWQPGDELEGTIPTDWHWYALTVRRSALEDRLETLGEDPAILRKLGAGPLDARSDLNALEHMLRSLYRDGCVAGPVGDAASVEERLILAFFDAVTPAPSRRAVSKRPHTLLRRAEEYLLSALDRPVTTTELCGLLRCSRRQIEKVFSDCYGLGPIAYHRKLRLNEIQRHLLADPPKRGAVSEVAQNFGFTHMGRFSASYKAMFGETPNQTMRHLV